jgi:hypothetical protein
MSAPRRASVAAHRRLGAGLAIALACALAAPALA